MKALITAPPLQYPSPFSLHARFSLRSLHDNLLSSPIFFSLNKQRRSPDFMAMAACVRSALRTENPQVSQHPNRPKSVGNPIKFVNFRRPISHNGVKTLQSDEIWRKMREEALSDVSHEPILSDYYQDSILSHYSLESALANHLSIKLSISSLPSGTLYDILFGAFAADPDIMAAVREDLTAVLERDPACVSYTHCFLNFKGFLAIQCHRIAHKLWSNGRRVLALLIQNRVSEVFSVDIHPGAKMGRGILLDHATGLVVGETAVVGNNVSILHNVTLGGTGKASGDRHPKIGDGVLIGAGTCILGNIRVGEGAKIGAGSVVLKDVPPRTTAVGNPARLVGGKENPVRLDKIPSLTMDQTSHISDWSDYVI